MAIQKQEYKVLSSDRVHQLAGVVYLPEGEPVGFFHVVHGMTEYIGRYERFMTKMAENGWICFGYDHLGHGYTVNNDSELGYIAKKDGWSLLVQDVQSLGKIEVKTRKRTEIFHVNANQPHTPTSSPQSARKPQAITRSFSRSESEDAITRRTNSPLSETSWR